LANFQIAWQLISGIHLVRSRFWTQSIFSLTRRYFVVLVINQIYPRNPEIGLVSKGEKHFSYYFHTKKPQKLAVFSWFFRVFLEIFGTFLYRILHFYRAFILLVLTMF
jgi:hypothetical protein